MVKAQEAAAEAMAQAARGVTDEWRIAFIEGAVFALLKSRLITMDDVWEVVDKPTVGDSRASGQVMKAYIVKAGYASLATSCPECAHEFGSRIALSRDSADGHGRNLRVWNSHIYDPSASPSRWAELIGAVQL